MASTNIGPEIILSNGTCMGYFSSVQRLCAQWKRGPSQAGIPQSQLAWFITHPKGCFSVRFLLGNNSSLKVSPSRTWGPANNSCFSCPDHKCYESLMGCMDPAVWILNISQNIC